MFASGVVESYWFVFRMFTRRLFLFVFCGLVLMLNSASALQLSEYAGSGEVRGIFKGIVQGKYRIQGMKKPFQGWILQTSDSEESIYALLDYEPSVRKVLSDPASYVGRQCTVTWDMIEDELVVNNRLEMTDITRIRDVKWASKAGSSSSVTVRSSSVSIEGVIRAFFQGIEDRDLGAVTRLLDDGVEYYQPRPISRSAALADIKSDWKRYSNWRGIITDFRVVSPTSCTFKLTYTLMEGARRRSSTLQCSASVNPSRPNVINRISASVVKSPR
jgi:hypothetical protein